MGSKIWVTQFNHRLDHSELERNFGEVVFLTRQEYVPDVDAGNFNANKEVMHEVFRKLYDFDTEKDYLVPAGSPIINGLAFAAMMKLHKTPFRVLKYNNRTERYNLVTIFLPNLNKV